MGGRVRGVESEGEVRGSERGWGRERRERESPDM